GELLGEQEIDDSFRCRRAAVKQDGADQRLDGVCENRRALRATGAQLARSQPELGVDAEPLTDCRERRLFDERGARTTQVALRVVAAKVVQTARDGEVQER